MRGLSRLAAVVLVLVATAGGAAGAEAQPSERHIRWWLSPFPPNIFPLSAQHVGIVHRMLLDVAGRLPDIEHSFEEIPSTRFHSEVSKGALACSSPILRSNIRESYLAYTEAGLHVLPNRLFVRPEKVSEVTLDASGVVDLGATLAAGLRLVVPQHRVFGGPIDEALTAAVKLPRVAKNEQPFLMYQAGRTDAFIGLPHEVAYHFQDREKNYRSFVLPGSPLIFVPIVACTRSPWGLMMIARIDGLATVEIAHAFYQEYRQWLDADSRSDFERHLALLPGGIDRPGGS